MIKDWKLGIDYVWPLKRYRITDYFHMPSRPNHDGDDLCGEVGDEVFSCFSGRVFGIYKSGAPGGMTVDIINFDGIRATYSHLDHVMLDKGQDVAMGQMIGVLGAYPADKPRPHIHFQLWVDGEWVNPSQTLQMPKHWGV